MQPEEKRSSAAGDRIIPPEGRTYRQTNPVARFPQPSLKCLYEIPKNGVVDPGIPEYAAMSPYRRQLRHGNSAAAKARRRRSPRGSQGFFGRKVPPPLPLSHRKREARQSRTSLHFRKKPVFTRVSYLLKYLFKRPANALP